MSTPESVAKGSQTVSLADEEGVKDILVSTVFGLWEIVNNLTRLRPSKREGYRVTIFGSARARPGTVAYGEVKRVAAALAEMGCDIITGGGPGLMQAANEGAAAADAPERNRSVGIRVDLPFEQEVNPFVEQAFEHKTFFTRLHHFVLASDAFVVAPGGIGTLLAAAMGASWALGWWRGRASGKEEREAPASKFQDAILAVLGLLLAFTFSMSLGKHEQRRQMVVADSNAIGDFYTSVSLLKEPV